METFEIIYLFVVIVIAIWISVIDFRYKRIPNQLVLLLGGIGICRFMIENRVWGNSVIDALGGMILGFSIFMVPALTKKNIGAGDVKLMTMIGLNVGANGVAYTIIAMGIGMVIYFIVRAIENKKIYLKQSIPLGPFMMIGMLVYLIGFMEGKIG